MSHCCVQDCTQKRTELPYYKRSISFHRFPDATKSPERYKKWLSVINTKYNVSRKTIVCSNHFVDEDFEVPPIVMKSIPENLRSKPVLKKTAVPSQCLSKKESVEPSIGLDNDESGSNSNSIEICPHFMTDKPEEIFLMDSNGFLTKEVVEGNVVQVTNTVGVECELSQDCKASQNNEENTVLCQKNGSNALPFAENYSDPTEIKSEDTSDDNFYLVRWKNLKELFKKCNLCSEDIIDISKTESECSICVVSVCVNNHHQTWNS